MNSSRVPELDPTSATFGQKHTCALVMCYTDFEELFLGEAWRWTPMEWTIVPLREIRNWALRSLGRDGPERRQEIDRGESVTPCEELRR